MEQDESDKCAVDKADLVVIDDADETKDGNDDEVMIVDDDEDEEGPQKDETVAAKTDDVSSQSAEQTAEDAKAPSASSSVSVGLDEDGVEVEDLAGMEGWE